MSRKRHKLIGSMQKYEKNASNTVHRVTSDENLNNGGLSLKSTITVYEAGYK